eukprot:403339000
MSDKTTGIVVAGASSTVLTGIGVGLMFLGPMGMIAGGIVLGGGISGGVNTIQQGISDKEDFEYEQWGVGMGIGAAGGLIAAPFAVGGAALATGLSTSARFGVQVGAGALGGSVAGGSTQAMSNVASGKDALDGVGTAVITGGLAGGIGAGIGQATRGISGALTKGANEVGQEVGRNAVIRVTTQTVGGAIGGGTSGAISTLIKNAIQNGEISKKELISYLWQYFSGDIYQEDVDDIWRLFKKWNMVKGDILFLKKNKVLDLPNRLIKFKEPLQALALTINDMTRGMGQAIVISATIGGVVSGIQGAAQENQLRKQYENQVREYSKNNTGQNGKSSSTIDAKILGQKTGKTQIIHKDDGERIVLKADGGENKRVQNYKFMEEGHYRPADKSGQGQISRTDTKQDGNCFMQLAKQQLNAKSTQDARQQLNNFAQKDPLTAAKYVTKQELMSGGYCKGGGLENLHIKDQYQDQRITEGNGKNGNVVKCTDKEGRVQFYKKGPYYNEQDLEKEYQKYLKLEKLGVGLPVKSEDYCIYIEPGVSIKDAIRQGILPADFGNQLKQQVKILEQNGLAHCDIKPDNIVVHQGKIKLIDPECLTKIGDYKPQFARNYPLIKATAQIDQAAAEKTTKQIINLQKYYKSGSGNQNWH